jgi:hypothetical protein
MDEVQKPSNSEDNLVFENINIIGALFASSCTESHPPKKKKMPGASLFDIKSMLLVSWNDVMGNNCKLSAECVVLCKIRTSQ